MVLHRMYWVFSNSAVVRSEASATQDRARLSEQEPVLDLDVGKAEVVQDFGGGGVVWHHSDLLRPSWAPATYGRAQRALYRRAACVIVSSPALAAQSALSQYAQRIAVIPFGIDLTRYRRTDADRQARIDAIRELTHGPRLLFVGRLVYYKGLHVLLDAAHKWPGSVIVAGEGPL